MIEHWSDKYIGAPFEQQGDGPTAFDCWGLIRHVLDKEFGVRIPSYGYDYADDAGCRKIVDDHAHEYAKVDGPAEGVVVLWHFKGVRPHVGICINSTDMLHMAGPQGAAVVRLSSSKVRNGILGYYLPTRSAA